MDITLLIGACWTPQAVPQYVVHDAKITGGMTIWQQRTPKCISSVESYLNWEMEQKSNWEDYSKVQNTFKFDVETRFEN